MEANDVFKYILAQQKSMEKESNETPFLLVNLKEDKAKKLAQTISNESCRKILEFLTQKKEATESEISKELNIPISTAHYNLQHLQKSGLVMVDEYHYSKKGKEVNHYKLANKFIIIAPSEEKESESLLKKLKDILPLGIFAAVAAGGIKLFQFLRPSEKMLSVDTVQESAGIMAARSAPLPPQQSEPNIALWFLLGAASVILFYIVWKLLKERKNSK